MAVLSTLRPVVEPLWFGIGAATTIACDALFVTSLLLVAEAAGQRLGWYTPAEHENETEDAHAAGDGGRVGKQTWERRVKAWLEEQQQQQEEALTGVADADGSEEDAGSEQQHCEGEEEQKEQQEQPEATKEHHEAESDREQVHQEQPKLQQETEEHSERKQDHHEEPERKETAASTAGDPLSYAEMVRKRIAHRRQREARQMELAELASAMAAASGPDSGLFTSASAGKAAGTRADLPHSAAEVAQIRDTSSRAAPADEGNYNDGRK